MKNGRTTKGEAEASIRKAVIKFEQEFRGPMDVKAIILRGLVIVRL